MATRHTSYHPSGQVAAEWGDQTYPTYKLYNLRGQMKELRTYQNQTSEPTASTPGYATTTWNYEPATGLLLSKLDANSKGASYTYSDDGKLLTRTWARTISGAPLSTSYTYTPAGQLFTTDYSDTTPDVSIRYDRLGRQLTQTNGLATSTFAYDPATLALDTETITYDLNADGTADFTRVLDRSSDDLGRDKGFQLKNGNTVENEAKYGYHATTARLTEISNPQISNLKFTYDYVGNSSLIDAITGPVHSVDLIWEPTRNVLEKRENQVAGNMISGYQYSVNELGQRTDVTQTGSVFAAGQGIAWGYDALGQVTSADHTTQNTQDRAYQYDTIGNRLAAEISNPQISNPPGPNTSIYTANTLNQYTAVGNQTPTHDDDGNLRLDGGVNKDNEPREYVWDAENRLASVKRVSDGAPIVSYLYDSQSRRIARTQGAATTLYLYDAWNCIAEYSIQNSAFTLQNSRLWGLDLSGTLQGAGGVDGMLAERHHSSTDATFYPTYDGNGNISEYLAQTGTPAARFEYDPFGNTVVNTDATNQFACRFSTKPADAATGLYYYGYRYYDPVTGRWPSRDPIGENGGTNLQVFAQNSGVMRIDVLGLMTPYGWGAPLVSNPERSGNCCDDPKPKNLSFAFDWSPRTRPLDTAHKDDELPWFKRIARSRDGAIPNHEESGVSGKDLLNAMYNASKGCHCIKTMTTGGHGGGAGSSLDYIESPKWKKDAGFYVYQPSPTKPDGSPNERYDADSRSLDDLKNQIKWKGIRFCKPCLIQIHQCRSSRTLIQELSRATGCKVIGALGGAHGEDYNDPNVWISDGGQWIESENGSAPKEVGNRYVPQ